VTRFQRGLRATFSAFAVRNYRLFFVGQVISITGTWMQMIAQSWLVLELTNSATVLGLVTALQWLPILVLGPWAGVLADRVDKRRLLMVTQVLSGTLALVLGSLVVTDVVELWMVLVIAGTLGVVSAIDMPARQSFVLEMVGPERLTNAVSLNTITMNMGRLVGPAIAGLVISYWDLAVCFIANGISFVAAVIALAVMRTDELQTTPPVQRSKGQLREGLRYVWATPTLRAPLLLMLAIGMFTYEFQVTLPVLARDTYGVGADGFGALQSAMSVGAIVGGLLFATRTDPTHRRLGLAAGGFGLIVLVLAAAPGFGAAIVVLPVVGLGSVMFLTLANSTLQLSAAPEMRSRVMALYTVAFIGSTPIGGPIVGAVAQAFGARWALVFGGTVAVVAASVAWRFLRSQPGLRPLRDAAPAEEPLPSAPPLTTTATA
jgi:MFS family permease